MSLARQVTGFFISTIPQEKISGLPKMASKQELNFFERYY